MTVNVFAVQIFFICFRECVETTIIVSVLLAFLKQTLGGEADKQIHNKLLKQIWWGVGLGLLIVLIIGCGMIGAFYGLNKDVFSGAEDLWEGIFGIIASLIISIMGAALLRVNKLQDKWRVKIAIALGHQGLPVGMDGLEEEKPSLKKRWGRKVAAAFGSRGASGRNTKLSIRFKKWAERYAMFLLPFVTVLREGLEAVVYIGGVSLTLPASSFPLAVVCGLLAGCAVGYLIYRGGRGPSLQIFLIISTCFLYLVAAGLFSKAVWYFENYRWSLVTGNDASETGSGPGSYDIRQSVWHVNCCNAELNGGGGWGIFNAILGWENSATYGTILSYNLYWLTIICVFVSMRYKEVKGQWPWGKAKQQSSIAESEHSEETGQTYIIKEDQVVGVTTKSAATEL